MVERVSNGWVVEMGWDGMGWRWEYEHEHCERWSCAIALFAASCDKIAMI